MFNNYQYKDSPKTFLDNIILLASFIAFSFLTSAGAAVMGFWLLNNPIPNLEVQNPDPALVEELMRERISIAKTLLLIGFGGSAAGSIGTVALNKQQTTIGKNGNSAL